jgi:hypothetical protein
MRQVQLDSNSDLTATRRSWRRPQIFAAGLIALVIAAIAVFDLSGGRIAAGSDSSVSSIVSLAAAPAERSAANSGTASTIDTSRPHFERSNEPAQEDPVNAHGG